MNYHKTLTQFLLEHLASHKEQKDLTLIMSDLATIGKFISEKVNKAGVSTLIGKTGETNIQSEQVKKLDEYANTEIIEYLKQTNHFALLASEEEDDVVDMGIYGENAQFIIAFDPLDGSSNTDINAIMGTIFSIHKRRMDIDRCSPEQFNQIGRNQILAGYIMYGSSTVLVFTFGDGVFEFTYDPARGEFLLSREKAQIPNSYTYYTVNHGKSHLYSDHDNAFIKYITVEKKSSTRNFACMVADCHRTLLEGGIYMYPEMTENDGTTKAKIRLNYESKPLAFIMEQAGGMATDGKNDILDIEPTSLHQRTPIFIGSKNIIQDHLNLKVL